MGGGTPNELKLPIAMCAPLLCLFICFQAGADPSMCNKMKKMKKKQRARERGVLMRNKMSPWISLDLVCC